MEKDITPYELAKMIRVNNNTIYEWLSGTKLPRRENLIALSEALRVPYSALTADLPITPLRLKEAAAVA